MTTGRLVTLAELSVTVGRSERLLIEWTDAGMPCQSRGGEGKASSYNTAEVVAWMLGQAAAKRDPTVETERRRLLAAQATRAELELAARAGVLVDAVRFREGAARATRALTDALLAVPARIAPVLDPANARRAQDLIDAELRQVLANMQQYLETLAAPDEAHAGAAQLRVVGSNE